VSNLSLNTFEMCDKQSENLDEDTSESLMQDDQQSMSSGVSTQQTSLEGYNFTVPNNPAYRVIQVTPGTGDVSLVPVNSVQSILNQSSTTAVNGPQVAFVTNGINGDGDNNNQTTSSTSDLQVAKYAYFQSSSSSNDLSQTTESQDHPNVPGAGQFYVMMSSQDMVLQNSTRSIASRKIDNQRGLPISVRDSNRRTQHNEVERRRRDKINNWIMRLSKLVPDCAGDNTKQGQSKGGILAKTCEYIADLQSTNQRFSESVAKLERVQLDYEVARLELEETKQENLILRRTLQNHGLEVNITSTSSSH